MNRLFACAVGMLCALMASPAAAQFAPTLDEDTTLLEGVVVRAYGGPPWWKVSDADSTVYILATPDGVPAGWNFDRTLLNRRLTGAGSLILPPRMELGPLAVLAAPAVNKVFNQLNDHKVDRLEPRLPADIRARFVRIRESIGQPATRYGALAPGTAAVALLGDASQHYNRAAVQSGERWKSFDEMVIEAARAKKVRVRYADSFGGLLLADAAGDMNRLGIPCLVSTLDLIEGKGRPPTPPGAYRAAVLAWGEGDIGPLIANARRNQTPVLSYNILRRNKSMFMSAGTEECLRAIPAVVRARERMVSGPTNAIAQVLRRRGGHAVALVEPVSLVMTNGVLDRLKRQGFTITAPGAE